jgi:hypothetical protein
MVQQFDAAPRELSADPKPSGATGRRPAAPVHAPSDCGLLTGNGKDLYFARFPERGSAPTSRTQEGRFMSKVRKRSETSFDDSELFSDQDFVLPVFIDSMETESQRRRQRARQQTSRHKLDEWREAKWLRDQLQDWDDWDTDR